MPAFRIAGGILLFLTALDMLFERRTQRREGQKSDPHHDPSVFPLATPLIAGPGAIASMILLVGQSGPGWARHDCGAWADARRDVVTSASCCSSPPGRRAAAGPDRNHRDHPAAGHAAGRAVGAVRDRRDRGHRPARSAARLRATRTAPYIRRETGGFMDSDTLGSAGLSGASCSARSAAGCWSNTATGWARRCARRWPGG